MQWLFYGEGGIICIALVIFSLLNCIFETKYKIKQKKIGFGFIFCWTSSGLFVDINIATQELSLIPLNSVLEIIYWSMWFLVDHSGRAV
jgi:hypothetical protein